MSFIFKDQRICVDHPNRLLRDSGTSRSVVSTIDGDDIDIRLCLAVVIGGGDGVAEGDGFTVGEEVEIECSN